MCANNNVEKMQRTAGRPESVVQSGIHISDILLLGWAKYQVGVPAVPARCASAQPRSSFSQLFVSRRNT